MRMKKLLTFLTLLTLFTLTAGAETSSLVFTEACGGTGTADDGGRRKDRAHNGEI